MSHSWTVITNDPFKVKQFLFNSVYDYPYRPNSIYQRYGHMTDFFDSQKNPREKLKCQSSIYKKEFAKVSNKIWVI